MPEPPPEREADRLIFAGLLGLAAAAVVQLSDNAALALPHFVEACAFALAIPLLAVGLVTDYARRAGTHIPVWRESIGLLGALSAVVGLGALFFHFGIVPGTVFAGATLVGVVLVRML